jgi:3D (Asp-Asp-Asp) domain-containing protein
MKPVLPIWGSVLLLATSCGAREEQILLEAAQTHRDKIEARAADSQDTTVDPTPSPKQGEDVVYPKENPHQNPKPSPKPDKIDVNDSNSPQDPTKPTKPSELTLEERALQFTLPEPESGQVEEAMNLWATYYYLPQVTSIADGYPLLASDGKKLGPSLSKKNWCSAAMEGSVRVTFEGVTKTYNYNSSSSEYQVDCSEYFSQRVGGTRFRLANGAFGDGVRNYKLIPFRTIAVDKKVIPYGTMLYIAKARGVKFTQADGTTAIHDGYFFAGDTGSAIKQNHIDVFIGVSKTNPFKWITSSSSGTFPGQIVENQDLLKTVTFLHTK